MEAFMKTMTKNISEELQKKVIANHPLIQIVSYEWRRIIGMLLKASQKTGRDVYLWSNIEGIKKISRDESTVREITVDKDKNGPVEAIEWFSEEVEKGNRMLFVMEDIHKYINGNGNGVTIISAIKRAIRLDGEGTLLIVQHAPVVIPELDKYIYMLEIPLPDIKIIETVIKEVKSKTGMNDEQCPPEDIPYLANAALGLTEMEAKQTFMEIAKTEGHLLRDDIELIVKTKEQIIKKSGILEYFHHQEGFGDVGGLENLKEWLRKRKKGFDPKARDFGLTPPTGVLLLGVPGCGKSLLAKAIASEWGLPLLKLDIGRVFAGIVGESEANIRKALQIAEGIAPDILWIDEIEKGLSGLESSGATDSGVTARVFGTVLTWMQEKQKPVFVVATANDISKLPPELLRKGRFDEIFFVDIPGPDSRKAVWEIHLKKRLSHRYDKLLQERKLDIQKLVEASAGYTGAEIEEAINEALYTAYSDDREVSTKDFVSALQLIYPISKTMPEVITNLRKWAKQRARLASDEEVENI